MSEGLGIFVLGVLAGIVAGVSANLLYDCVREWRSDEADRRRMRTYIELLIAEVERRLHFLSPGGEHPSDPEDEAWKDGDFAERTSLIEIESELTKLQVVFESDKRLILALPKDSAAMVLEHYQGVWKELRGSGGTFGALPKIRGQGQNLRDNLNRTLSEYAPRSFSRWLMLWVRGLAQC